MNIFKLKIISVILLLSFTFSDTRESSAVIDPFTIAIVASALIHAVVIGGVVLRKYYKRENGGTQPSTSHQVGASGSIGRESSVVWVELDSLGKIEQKSKSVTAKVTAAQLATANSAKLKSLVTNGVLGLDGLPVGPSLITRRLWNKYSDGTYIVGETPRIRRSLQRPGDCHVDSWDVTNHDYRFATEYSPVLTVETIPYELSRALTLDQSNSEVRSEFRGEIDDFITSNPNIVSYVDTTTAASVDNSAVFSPPSPSPSQIVNAQSVASASAATAAASNAVTVAQANLSANPTDPSLQQKLADSQAALSNAQSQQAIVEGDAAKDELSPLSTVDSSGRYTSIGLTISTRMTSLGSAMSGKFPFSVLTWAKGLLNQFNSGSTSAPVIPFTVGGFTANINLSVLDPLAVVTRFLSWVLFAIALAWSFKGYWHRE